MRIDWCYKVGKNPRAFPRTVERYRKWTTWNGWWSAVGQMQLIDYRAFISMNRKRPAAHPMLVDVDLKEGYPHGTA